VKGIAIDMTGDRPRILWDRSVSGVAAAAQNMVVGFVTERHPSDLFADRGTELFADSVSGMLVDATAVQHACNFAASDAFAFQSRFESETDTEIISKLVAKPTTIENNRLRVRLEMEAANGTALTTTF